MYSKTRNTLTALIAASLFVVAGWMLGHPLEATAVPQPTKTLHILVTGENINDAPQFAAIPARHSNRMNLAMPYFSFAVSLPQRRVN